MSVPKSIIAAMFFMGGVAAIISQTPPATTPATTPVAAETKPAGPASAIQLQDFDPVAVKDPRFTLTNVNFDRRYAPNGVGEFLDVVFDLKNLTSEPVDFYAYVIAFWETDAVDLNSRRLIPYPTWRVNDPARGEYLVHYITITPKDLADEEIWSDKDPDYKHYSHIVQSMRDSVATTEPVSDVHPPYWKYLSYISQHPAQGLKFKLYGDKGPGQHEVIQTNYVPPTAEEKKNKVHRTLSQHKFTIEHTRRMAIFRSHHYTAYRADFKFFNSVSIVLFDAKKADAYEEQRKAGGPKAGEAKIDPLIYKQTFKIGRPLKM